MGRSPLLYFLMSLLCQVVGFGAALLCQSFSPEHLWISIAVHAGIAGSCAFLLKLPKAWLWMNLMLWPAIFVFNSLNLNPNFLLLGLTCLLLIYIPTFWTRVPFYPSSFDMYRAILSQLPTDKSFKFIDLGCGYGTMLHYLANQRPRAEFAGVEIAPLPILFAKLKAQITSSPVKYQLGSFWNLDLSEYEYIYAFLAPDPMPKLWEKLKGEMKSGSLLLINSFPIPRKADKEIQLSDQRNCKLYVYQIK